MYIYPTHRIYIKMKIQAGVFMVILFIKIYKTHPSYILQREKIWNKYISRESSFPHIHIYMYQFYIGKTANRVSLFILYRSSNWFKRKDRVAGPCSVPTGSVRSSYSPSSTFLFATRSPSSRPLLRFLPFSSDDATCDFISRFYSPGRGER